MPPLTSTFDRCMIPGAVQQTGFYQGDFMRLVAITLFLVFFSTVLFGQAGTGTITGIVSDPAGAVVAGANVEVRNTDTNAPYPTVTTETGAYTVPAAATGTLQRERDRAGIQEIHPYRPDRGRRPDCTAQSRAASG